MTVLLSAREAEEAVLGAILSTGVIPDKVAAQVERVHFYSEKHRLIWDAVCSVDEPAVAFVAAELERRGTLEKAGGSAYLHSLLSAGVVAGQASEFARLVRDDYIRREVHREAEAMLQLSDVNGQLSTTVERLQRLQATSTAADVPTTWASVDLAPVLSGESADPPPSMLEREDGHCLLYESLLHLVAGEPEAGKGWLALYACAEQIAIGNHVAYVDFEDRAERVVARLRELGICAADTGRLFHYIRPDEPLTARAQRDLKPIMALGPALVVIDGLTEAMALEGLDVNSNTDVAKWLFLLARPAGNAGAAVLMQDHVTKDKEKRGRYGLGAGHKRAGVDVTYMLEPVEPFGRGLDGMSRLSVTKDRPGHVRQHAEGDYIAEMRVLSRPDHVRIQLDPPSEREPFRPTVLMERISRAIEESPGLNKNGVRGLRGNNDAKETALRLLVEEKFVHVEQDGQARKHYSVRPYRGDEE
jgi:hypothetical protein